ncbi:hypothetical protein SUDANB180_04631 [Streptomyces sp. enrichment culture]
MASHRKPRPGGSRPAVVPTPTMTSMAVFSRPTETAPTPGQGVPTPEEIARKVDDFYRQAESALAASAEGNGVGERWGRGDRGVRTARGGRGQQGVRAAQGGPGAQRVGGSEAERARFADGDGRGKSGTYAAQDVPGERGGRAYGSERGEWARRADTAGGGPRDGSAGRDGDAEQGESRGQGGGGGQGGDVGQKGRREPAEWAVPAERAGISLTAEGSLQRLRDEIARRARQRSLPGARGMVPAQRGTRQSGPGMGQAGFDTAQAEPGTTQAEPGPSQVPLGSGHVTHGTGRTAQVTGQVSRRTGEVERAPLPAGSPAALAPPLQPTAPCQAMQNPPTAQETVSVAAPTGSRLEPINRRLEPTPTARRSDATTPRSGAPASGPKAVKVVTREKLTHARVLLYRHQRIIQTLGTPPGTYATKAGKAVAFARAQLGKPCVWGAAGPGSYDCAGLTRAAWKSAGVTLPRTASAQAGVGIPVPPAEARPGDLVFFHDDADHVGLCTGDGMMIHAPRPGAYVREQPVSALGDAAVHSVVRPG